MGQWDCLFVACFDVYCVCMVWLCLCICMHLLPTFRWFVWYECPITSRVCRGSILLVPFVVPSVSSLLHRRWGYLGVTAVLIRETIWSPQRGLIAILCQRCDVPWQIVDTGGLGCFSRYPATMGGLAGTLTMDKLALVLPFFNKSVGPTLTGQTPPWTPLAPR